MRKLALVVVLLGGCVVDGEFGTATSEVIGGKASIAGAFPGVGALMFDVGGGGPQIGCTGTLIAPDVVLTAAHCVDPQLTGGAMPGFTLALDVRMTANPAPVIVAGRTTMKHEMFNLANGTGMGLGQLFDIGLVFLAQPITEVAPVPMPRPEDSAEIIATLDMQIAGYGKTTVSGDNIGILFDAPTKLVSLDPSEIQVGMGSPQPQNCNGDSGGPGFAMIGGKRRVIGITSRSFMGVECTAGGVDTRVDAYLDWVQAKVPTGIPCGSGMAEACPGEDEAGGGCCSTSSRSAPGSVALSLAIGALVLRRRRR